MAARHGFFNSAQDWLGSLDKVKKKYNAVKLFKTLKALLTRIKRNSKTKKPVLKIRITFPDEISNQYFSPGAPEGVLTMLPIPYVFEHETINRKTNKATKFKTTEANLLWRVFTVDSDCPIEDDASVQDDDIRGLIGEMLGKLN